MTTKEELFNKYSLSFNVLSSYMSALYDGKVNTHLDFAEVRDSLSDGQTASKLWIIDELKNLNLPIKSVNVFGGWVGLLCRFLFEYLDCQTVANVEIDETLLTVNNFLNKMTYGERFKFIHNDMYEFDYQNDPVDLYINTSGEHIVSIADWIEMIPENKLVLVQSNNFFFHPTHINCVNTAEELKAQILNSSNIKSIEYCGTLKLPIYNRFMVIAKT